MHWISVERINVQAPIQFTLSHHNLQFLVSLPLDDQRESKGISIICFQREATIKIIGVQCTMTMQESCSSNNLVNKTFDLQLKSGDGSQFKIYESDFTNRSAKIDDRPLVFHIFTADNIEGFATSQLVDIRHSQNLSSLLANKILTDVCFQVGGEIIRAHRSVISARSPVLAALLTAHFEKEEKKKGNVSISSVQSNVFKAILDFIYTGTLSGPFSVHSRPFSAAAEEFKLQTLVNLCRMVSNGPTNYEDIFEISLF